MMAHDVRRVGLATGGSQHRIGARLGIGRLSLGDRTRPRPAPRRELVAQFVRRPGAPASWLGVTHLFEGVSDPGGFDHAERGVRRDDPLQPEACRSEQTLEVLFGALLAA